MRPFSTLCFTALFLTSVAACSNDKPEAYEETLDEAREVTEELDDAVEDTAEDLEDVADQVDADDEPSM